MHLAAVLLLSLSSTYDARGAAEAALGHKVVEAANHFLQVRPPGPNQCTNYVKHVFRRVGIELGGGADDMWARAESLDALHYDPRPSVGDIAFFDNTFDRDGNGRVDDPLTHVGVVLNVAGDGTITVAHGGATHGTGVFRMNLEHPSERSSPDGKRWNDYLRHKRAGDPPNARYLASELVAGFATVRYEDAAGWKPSGG